MKFRHFQFIQHFNFKTKYLFQLRRSGEFVPAIHPSHPIYANNRLRQFSQFVRVIEESDIQLQRCMRGATRVSYFNGIIERIKFTVWIIYHLKIIGYNRTKYISTQIQACTTSKWAGWRRWRWKVYHLLVTIWNWKWCKTIALHASLPHGLCRSMADNQQTLPNMSSWHWNTFKQRHHSHLIHYKFTELWNYQYQYQFTEINLLPQRLQQIAVLHNSMANSIENVISFSLFIGSIRVCKTIIS